MSNKELGVFDSFWDNEYPHHLPLLNLRNSKENKNFNLEISLLRIESIFHKNDKQFIIKDLERLISEKNWRPQLVFCISILKLKEENISSLIDKLWQKLEENQSFVSPQLAVTASIVDAKFNSKAIAILNSRDSATNFESLSTEELLIALIQSTLSIEDKSKIALDWKNNLFKINL